MDKNIHQEAEEEFQRILQPVQNKIQRVDGQERLGSGQSH